MISISWTQLLAGAFALAIAVASGAFTATKFAVESEIKGYSLRIEQLERQTRETEKRLMLCLKANDREVSKRPTKELDSNSSLPLVEITSLKSGELVGISHTIKASVLGKLPIGYHTIVAIRDPLGQWWSWGKIKSGDPLMVQFGEERDSGESFEVRVLITDESFLKNQPHSVLPSAIASDSAIVIRE